MLNSVVSPSATRAYEALKESRAKEAKLQSAIKRADKVEAQSPRGAAFHAARTKLNAAENEFHAADGRALTAVNLYTENYGQ